jgi:peptide/nickel transport system ATP-binding protein
MSDPQPVISAKDINIDYRIDGQWLNVIRNVELSILPVQIHGLVGESGSGKSTLALGMMRFMADNARISSGQLVFEGEDIVNYSQSQLRNLWGKSIGLMPQNPLASLNPTMTIGKQMIEAMVIHLRMSESDALKQAESLLLKVKLADADRILNRYPHQLSGGMQQRVMIAMALSTRPRFLVLDEPTTALDVTTQAVILDLFRELILNEQAAALYVSHDLGTVAQLCDYVTVLYAGEVMESASVDDLYAQPLHPYTSGLLASLPSYVQGNEARLSTIDGVAPSLSERSHACVFADRCPVAIDKCHSEKPPLETTPESHLIRCWRWQEIADGDIIPRNKPTGLNESSTPTESYVLDTRQISKRFGEQSLFDRLTGKAPDYVQAVDDVSLKIRERSTLGLVGESGSGKTTLARAIVALHTADQGEIELCDIPLSKQLNQRTKQAMQNLQMVFQNPHDALNPYMTVGDTIGRTIQVLSDEYSNKKDRQQRVKELLQSVGLTAQYAHRYPDQLSGGEKQRVAIARAFATNPALVVADEPTSSLDVSVQAVILNLLKDLRAKEGASYLLISHDLEVISYLSDWIVVMYLGEIMEEGDTQGVYEIPSHPYTEALLSAIPLPDPQIQQGQIRLEGDIPSPQNKPTGCPFHTRCPRYIGDICKTDDPPMRDAGDGHKIRCHIPIDELTELQSQSIQGGN